jgi:hypothetical protein
LLRISVDKSGGIRRKRGEDSIFDEIKIYKPSLIQYFIFSKKKKFSVTTQGRAISTLSNSKLNSLKVAMNSKIPNNNLSVIHENGCIILENRIKLLNHHKRPEKYENGWLSIHVSDVKKIIRATEDMIKKQVLKITSSMEDIRHIGTYNILISASKPGYWLQSKVDISKFKYEGLASQPKLDSIKTHSRLEHFNRALFGPNHQIKGNYLNTSNLPSRMYWLCNNGDGNNCHAFSEFFIIDIVVDRIEEKYSVESDSVSKKYLSTQEMIIPKFRNFLITYSKLSDLYNDTYQDINLKSNRIRNNAIHLQQQINNLLRTKKKSGKKNRFRSRSGNKNPGKSTANNPISQKDIEEGLLEKASIYFSKLTSIDYILVEAMHSKQEYQRELDTASTALGLERNRALTTPDSIEAIPTLVDEFKRYYETIGYSFENLKTELEHTQSTLRNAVDVLKTFLEEKQRKISEASSKRINTLVIIFACFGLADALGNFVIFYLQGGAGLVAIIWFIITMLPLILIITVVWFGFLKFRI